MFFNKIKIKLKVEIMAIHPSHRFSDLAKKVRFSWTFKGLALHGCRTTWIFKQVLPYYFIG